MKDPAPKTTRDLRILNLKSARLFSSFLRGASYLKSPQNKFQKIEFLLCHMVFLHVKGMLATRGTRTTRAEFEQDGQRSNNTGNELEKRWPRSGQTHLAVGGFRPRFVSMQRLPRQRQMKTCAISIATDVAICLFDPSPWAEAAHG
jgi:hypothetical protein